MNLYAGLGFVAVAAGAVYLFGGQRPGDVYPMPVNTAYSKLMAVDFGELSEGEKALDTKKTVSGNGSNKVTWVHHGDMAHYECTMALASLPDDANSTHITVTCKGGGAGDGAAAGMAHNMFRNTIIERVDATLTGRPYDKRNAMGSTASRWPGDGVDGSIGTAVGTAMKMDADMRKMKADGERFREKEMADAARNAEDAREAAVQREERLKANGVFNDSSSAYQ